MTERSFFAARGRVVAALVGAGLLLSACQGGSPTPGDSPSASSSSASPSATATPTPSAKYVPASAKGKAQNVPVPVKPALADQNSKAGLEAFTTYWFALLSYGYETGDLTAWSKVTSKGCAFCSNLEKGVNNANKDGRWAVGGKFTLPSVKAEYKGANPSQQVVIQVIQSKIEYFKADGTTLREPTPASNSGSLIVARYESGSWSVVDLGLL
ncbi:DUF6318 family protein [Arthrobacter celericrescens]|uniref:DUF6318 family protein n=1 Tax=Arthrobacter celericrescens TaxID=2320851 RepID=UPI0013C3F008|nr:DUF6318 family protein [Arthrobacter celericrescens]